MTRLARFALIVGLALASGPASAQEHPRRPARPATIEFLDVGQGDAILIRSPEGKTALVDAGPHKELAADLLRGRGITSLDLVVLTHHHQDHYGGMEEVIRRFRPRVFLDNGSSHTTPHYLRLHRAGPRSGDHDHPAHRPPPPDRAGLGHPDGLAEGPREPRTRTTTAWGFASSTATFSVLLARRRRAGGTGLVGADGPGPVREGHGPQAGPPRLEQRHRRPMAGAGAPRTGGGERRRRERVRASRVGRRSPCWPGPGFRCSAPIGMGPSWSRATGGGGGSWAARSRRGGRPRRRARRSPGATPTRGRPGAGSTSTPPRRPSWRPCRASGR